MAVFGFSHGFLHVFFRILPRDGTRALQESPRPPKTAQKAPKRPPRGVQGASQEGPKRPNSKIFQKEN
eukprot:8651833-Pyramimonas_sp.AAC.1